MAKIRDFAFTEGTVPATTWSALMPTHQSGDVLIAMVTVTATLAWTNPDGWNVLQAQVDGSGHRMAFYYMVADSSSETLTIGTLSSATAYTTTVISIIGAKTSDVIEATATRTADDNVTPFAGVAVETFENNCLILTFLAADTGLGPLHTPGWIGIFNGDSGGSCGVSAYTYQRTAGTVPAMNWWGQTNDNTMAFTVAINDEGGAGAETYVPPYIQPGDSPGEMLEMGYWITGAGANAWGNTYPTSLTITTVGSKTAVFDAGAVQADTGVNPYNASLSHSPAQYSTGASIGMTQINFGSIIGTPHDLTGKLLATSYLFATPRDYVDLSTASDVGGAGILLMVRDGSAYHAWTIGAKRSATTIADSRNYAVVQVDQSTDTRYANAPTVNNSQIDGLVVGAQGVYGASLIYFSCFFLLDEVTLVGGSEANPITFDTMESTLNTCIGRFPVMLRSGSAATFLAPIKIGGADPVHITVNLRTLQYRTQADKVNYFDWHVDDNRCGFEFDGQAGDIIHFTNCVFTASSPQYWRFSSDFSASCNHNFSGTTVVNMTVTLRSTVTLDHTTFIDCPTFTQNAGVLTNCTFDNTKVTSASPAGAALISNSTFTSGGTGHAIEIGGTAASMTLTGVEFTGYAASDGSTGNEAIYVNIASGSMTISITGGGSIPSIRTAGATVTVQNSVTVKVTAKDATTLAAINAARVLMEANLVATGTHTGANNASTLTDSSKSFTTNELVNYRIYNTTDGSDGLITANDATMVTATLYGGTDNDWDTSDAYIIVAKPALNPVSIVRSDATATVTHRNHGLSNGASVVIRGATQDEYNGIYTIFNVSTNTYDYTVSGSPATPATGSPTSTAVILSGTTNASGILQTTAFNYKINQPVTGKVRKATSGTKYKTGTIVGTIASAGLDTTILLIADE
jgi:hypothetical protein